MTNSRLYNNIVYILGAGFSAPLGLPTMSNFWNKSIDIMKKNPVKYSYFEKIIQKFKETDLARSYFQHHQRNIEEAMSMLEMSEKIGEDSELDEFKRYVIDVIGECTPELIKSSRKTLDRGNWDKYLFGESGLNYEMFQWYGHFVASLHQLTARESMVSGAHEQYREIGFDQDHEVENSYSVVTLNYDMLLENYCKHMNEMSSFKKNVRFIMNMESPNPNSVAIPWLAKVHGSVETGEIILPTFIKGLHLKRVPPSWVMAYKLLEKANEIRIIGYSLPNTDAYIKYMLKSAISKSRDLTRIDILCKDGKNNEVKNRYDEFITFEHKFVNGNVEDYISQLYQFAKQVKGNDSERMIIRFNHLEEAHRHIFR